MADSSTHFNFELTNSINTNSLHENSNMVAERIRRTNPKSESKEMILKDAVANGKIGFPEALSVMRENALLKFNDPSTDNFDEGMILDPLQFFNFNEGNALRQPSRESADAFYVCEPLMRGVRLPVVIEGVRQVVNQMESSNKRKPENWKETKIKRFSKFLYALTDLQTDLITDELAKVTGEKWDEARKRVVHWKNMDQEIEEIEESSQKLRSVLERALIRTDGTGNIVGSEGKKDLVVSPVAYNLPKAQAI